MPRCAASVQRGMLRAQHMRSMGAGRATPGGTTCPDECIGGCSALGCMYVGMYDYIAVSTRLWRWWHPDWRCIQADVRCFGLPHCCCGNLYMGQSMCDGAYAHHIIPRLEMHYVSGCTAELPAPAPEPSTAGDTASVHCRMARPYDSMS